MIKRSIFFIAVILTACVGVYGQSYTVSGFVRDVRSAEPLAGATIFDDGHGNVSSSNHAGFYSMRLPAGSRLLKASYIGFGQDSVLLDLRRDTVVNFHLPEISTMLDRVTITSGREHFSVKESGQMAVNMKQVRFAPALLGEPDIIKFLQLMPGVSSGKEGSSQLAVRGGSGDQTLIMLDEVPIFNQNHAFGLISIFSSDALSGADLYKAYIPARYGGRLSSVASMRMRDGNKLEHRQSITVGTLTAGGHVEGPINKGKGSYILSARRFVPDLLLLGLYAVRKETTMELLYSFYDINAKVNYALGDNNRLYVSFYNGRDKFYNHNYDYDWNKIVARTGAGFSWGNISGSVKLETQAGKNVFVSNSVYFSQIDNRLYSKYEDIDGDDSSLTERTSAMYETGFRNSVEHKLGRHSLEYGLNAAYQFFAPISNVYTKNGITRRNDFFDMGLYSVSLFADDRISLGRFTLDAGVRFSLFHNGTEAGFGLEPRFAANMRVNDYNNTYVAYIRTVQPLQSVMKPYMGFPLDYWMPYSSTISSADQVSLGWKNSGVDNLTLTVEGYYKELHDLSLIFSLDDYLAGETDAYPASGRAYGVEFMALYSLGRLSLTGSYAYARSMRDIGNGYFPYTYDVPHSGNLYGTYTTLQRTNKTHTLSLNIACRSGFPFTVSEGSYSNWDEYVRLEDNPLLPNTRIRPYFRTDIGYSMERTLRKGSRIWQLSILNVTNHQNPYLIYKVGDSYKYSNLIPIFPSFSYKRMF